MSNKKVYNVLVRIVALSFTVVVVSTSVVSAAGDAGSGYNPSGGKCRGGSVGHVWHDTCFGLSWQYYKYDGSAPVEITGTDNAPGATISGICGEVGGFWHLGYERYVIASSAANDYSTGEQRGTGTLGLLKDYGGSARFYTRSAAPTGSFGSAVAQYYSDSTTEGGVVYGAFAEMKARDLRDNTNYTRGMSWGAGSPLGWFCSDDPTVNKSAGFGSTSSVSVSGGGSSTSPLDGTATPVTYTLPSGADSVTVAFWHVVKRTDSEKTSGNTKWTVNGQGLSTPATGTFASTETIRQSEVHRMNSITVNVAVGETKQICQNISYTPKTIGKSDSGSSRACAVITRGKEPTPVRSCPLPNSDYSIDFGGTQAQSGVVNLTKDGTWKTTSASASTVSVWARPGDNVRFKHTLCFGAQSVRGNNTDNGTTDSPRTEMPSTANTATIRAFTTPGSSGNYLFGKTLSGSSSQTFNLTKGQPKPSQVAGADETGDYWFTYYSPSVKAGNSAGDTYGCAAADRGFPNFITNSYQIPNFVSTTVPANCNSAKKVPTYSDAGKIIEQDLEYNNVRSWLTTHNTGAGGVCNCPQRSAYATNASHSYEQTSAYSSTIGTRVRKCYIASSTGCGWCGRDPSPGLRDYKYYPMTTEAPAGTTQKAQVKIPFNYTTTTTVNTNQSIVFGGGEYSVDAKININKRANTEVSTSSYATITKNSVYEVVAFTVDPSTSYTSIAHANEKSPGNGSMRACSYYSKGASSCLSVYRSSTMQLNEKGDLNGGVKNAFYGDLAVPDAEVGTKFCVAVGVWPSDSHNFTSGAAGTADTALDINNGAYWNYSEPTCRTITKKPTVQFHSAGAYTSGGITTSQTKKTVSYRFGQFGDGSNLQSGVARYGGDSEGSRRVFGSFTEYETIALKNVSGFASGAGFGYGQNNNGNLASSAALPGGYPGVQYTGEANTCTYSTQSFNNDKCSEKTIGASKINSFGTTILSRLTSRYTDSVREATQASSTINFNSFATLENGAKYIKINGDATIASSYCMNATSGATSNTFVIDVSGTLTISGDIKYGSGSGSNCDYENYRTIAELPQMLIFASDINIRSNVTNIDAWLISGQRNRGSGVINTCSDLSGSQLGNGHTIASGATTSVPCSSQLRVNGPVFAKKMILNRNAGAGTGNASIQAAEIFNLRPDTYLWAYNQASRFSQAVTTYTRELAPRY